MPRSLDGQGAPRRLAARQSRRLDGYGPELLWGDERTADVEMS